MPTIDFPGKTLGMGTGDYYDFNGKRWVWNGRAWTLQANGNIGPTGPTGAVSGDFVLSVNGITGPVGLSAGANIGITWSGKTLTISSTAVGEVTSVNGITGPVGITGSANISVSGSGKTLTISFVGDAGGVTSVNGVTGAVGVAAGTAIGVSTSGKTLTISNIGVTSFNGQTGAISFVDYAASVNGVTGAVGIAAGTAIAIATSGKTLTISNTGVTSFNGQTGAISFVDYAASVNGITGAVGISAGQGISVSASGKTLTVSNSGIVGLAAGSGMSITSPAGPTATITNAGVISILGGSNQVVGQVVLSAAADSGITMSAASTSSPIVFRNTGVLSANGITGAVGFTGTNITVSQSGKTLTFLGKGNLSDLNDVDISGGITNSQVLAYNTTFANYQPTNVVLSVNSITGVVGITAGSNITITRSGNTLTVASTASGGTAASVPDFILYRLGII